MPVTVICLEGCHGSGKTSLTAYCKDLGFSVMDEGFMQQPPALVHPQSLLMETVWVCGWFQRLMTHIMQLQKEGGKNLVIVADRSPYSAVFYSRSDGDLLKPLIGQYMAELRTVADVHIHTVLLRTERELLWSRIQHRLALEPSRLALRENERSWMDAVLAFYDKMKWDVEVPNDETTLRDLALSMLQRLASFSAAVEEPLMSYIRTLKGDIAAVAEAALAAAPAATPVKPAPSAEDVYATEVAVAAAVGAGTMNLSPSQPLAAGAVVAAPAESITGHNLASAFSKA